MKWQSFIKSKITFLNIVSVIRDTHLILFKTPLRIFPCVRSWCQWPCGVTFLCYAIVTLFTCLLIIHLRTFYIYVLMRFIVVHCCLTRSCFLLIIHFTSYYVECKANKQKLQSVLLYIQLTFREICRDVKPYLWVFQCGGTAFIICELKYEYNVFIWVYSYI